MRTEEGNVFAAELKRWRDVRGLSRTALASSMGYDRSYVSKIESGKERPSREFAAHAETALRAGGALRKAFHDHVATRRTGAERPALPTEAPDDTGSIVVDHDDATLYYDDEHGVYRLTQRRRLTNGGTEPVSRYLIRISVDRFPGDPERSNLLYSRSPLTWEEIGLRAWYGNGRDRQMRWQAHHDRDAFKEVWLVFAGGTGRFPLYPGESCWIEHEYTVTDEHWGSWFQRAVRLPTRRLSVRLDFPSHLDTTVWGLYTSMTADALPFPTAIERIVAEERHIFHWATQDPALHARFRLEWSFQHTPTAPAGAAKPSDTMRSLGIVQSDDLRLRNVARPFVLPDDAEDLRRVVVALQAAGERVARAHVFGKGMGIAAPQIGVDRAVAIVRPPGDVATITLVNPRVIESSVETDQQYEGCLSFFDVRGIVPRPLVIHVEHQDIDGRKRITVFERGMARLVAHEIDHLHGHLYTDHMSPDDQPIPVDEYRGSGSGWTYSPL